MDDDGNVTLHKIQTFVKTAEPFQRLTYHVGNLAAERITDRSLAEIAREAYNAAEHGHCTLLQRRYGRPSEGAMVYMLEKRGL